MGRVRQILGDRVYLDANIVVYIVQGFQSHADSLLELLTEMDQGGITAATSALTIAEVLVKPKQDKDLPLEQAFKDFLQPSQTLDLVPISESVLERAAEIRASIGVKLPDAIHIATAEAWGCSSLLTNDERLKSVPSCSVAMLGTLG